MTLQTVSLLWDGHHSTLLRVFEKLLENSQLVDCCIVTEGRKLKAHKEVLSAFSPYFELLFKEANENNPTIILDGVKFNDMRSLIDFMYQGKLEVSEERIEDLIDVAECLQIKGLGGIHEKNVLAGTNSTSIRQIPSDLSLIPIPTQPTQSTVDNLLLHGETLLESNIYPDVVVNIIEPQKEMDSREMILYDSNGNSNDIYGEHVILGSSLDISVTSDNRCENLPSDCVPLEVLNSQSCSRSLIVASERNELNNINLPLHLDITVTAVGTEDTLLHSEFHVKTEQSGEDETLMTECVDLTTEKDECSESMLQSIASPTVSVEMVEKNEKCSSDSSDGAAGRTEDKSANPPQRLVSVLRTLRRPGRKRTAEMMPELPAPEPQDSSSRKRCGKDVPDPSGMNANMQNISTKKKCRCQQCGKILSNLSGLKLHMRTHTHEGLYRCDKCKYAAVSLNMLEKHKKIHNMHKPYNCAHCDYKTARRPAFIEHQRIHSGLKPYKCTQCNYASAQSRGLRQHRYAHSGQKPYQCPECDYATVNNYDLETHSRTHSHLKPFKCTECDYASAQRSNLKTHQRKHHGLAPYKCMGNKGNHLKTSELVGYVNLNF